MQDTELYRHLLGIEDPWSVGRVELNLAQQRVDVWAEHAADRKWSCTQCGKLLSLYDHSEERVWRHLDSCQFMTYLHARPPRVHCPEHGVRQVELSWAHLDRGTVEYIGEDRREASLDWYFNALTEEQRQGIEAIAMDMWDPFVAAVRTHVPEGEAKIVYDRFHVMKHMGDAVNEVRKREHRQLQAAGDETLAGSRFLRLYAEENLPDRHRERFARLKATNLKTGRAWAIKESLRDLWSCRLRNSALQHWKRWHFWATHSRLPAVIDVARMVRLRLANVLRYYSHRITNAVSEGLNSKIQTIKKMAYGFRNRDHFKAAIYFHCGGLDLDPTTHAEA